jgi:hypothetical protein
MRCRLAAQVAQSPAQFARFGGPLRTSQYTIRPWSVSRPMFMSHDWWTPAPATLNSWHPQKPRGKCRRLHAGVKPVAPVRVNLSVCRNGGATVAAPPAHANPNPLAVPRCGLSVDRVDSGRENARQRPPRKEAPGIVRFLRPRLYCALPRGNVVRCAFFPPAGLLPQPPDTTAQSAHLGEAHDG